MSRSGRSVQAADVRPIAGGFAVREVSWSDADMRSRSASAAERATRNPASYSTLSSKSYLSRLTFSWVNPLMDIGQARGHLEHEDLDELVGKDSTEFLSAWFERVWTEEVETAREFNRKARWKAWRVGAKPERKEPSLLRALFTCFGWRYLALGFLKLISDCLMFSGPVLLGYLVNFVESYEHHSTTPPEAQWRGYLYAGGLVLGVLLSAISNTQYTFAIRRVGLYLRAVVVTAVYRKALRISNTAKRDFSAGNINNVMSVDTDRVTDISISVHEFWSLPVQIGIALYLLYREVSWSLLAGLAIVILLIPLNAYIMNRINSVSKAMMRFKDQRISLLDEVIRHIRTIKYMAMETRFARRILQVRALEMGQLAIRKYLDALCVYFWATTPILVSLVTFATYSYILGHTLTSAKVFSSLALFQILIRPLNAFPCKSQQKVGLQLIVKSLNADTVFLLRSCP
jgi:ATP-binding cassette subfamily C (CFTR/MRP) protein 10